MSVLPAKEPQCERSSDADIDLVIAARPRDLGGLSVRRVLPSPARRLLGPFIFFDHMGPAALAPGHGIDVRPHPHINLATVTYLFEGEFVHRDSLGSEQPIRPGAVNWMTAGRGIVHSERTGAEARMRGSRVHGIQSWVALPVALEEVAPSFQHHSANTIPEMHVGGVLVRVIAGTAYGLTSPVRTTSPTLYVDARLDALAELAIPEDHEERAAYVVEGTLACDGGTYGEGTMVVFRPGARPRVSAPEPTRIMIVGGAKLDGERHIYWNFVSSSPERIERAKREWKEDLFPRVPGDDKERIPLPER